MEKDARSEPAIVKLGIVNGFRHFFETCPHPPAPNRNGPSGSANTPQGCGYT